MRPIDKVKLSKIWRLGIDTVQVTIPKESEEAIEKCFYKTDRTKWIFNYERETTPFLSIPKGNTARIPLDDEFERKLLKTAESFACRSSQIGNLIRGLKKCLESEPYRRIEQTIRAELARVEENSERDRERLFDLRAEHRAAVERRFEQAEADLRREEEEFIRAERVFQENYEDLERRYSAKREELEGVQSQYQPECQSEVERIERYLQERGETKLSIAEQIRAVENEEIEFEEETRAEEERIEEANTRARDFISELGRGRVELPSKYDRIEKEIREEFDTRKIRAQEDFRKARERARREINDSGRETLESIKNRYSWKASEIERRVKKAISGGGILLSISEGKGRVRALEEIKRLHDSGAYKSWD